MRHISASLSIIPALMFGCDVFEEEACIRLCSRTTARLSDCEPEWPVEWEELGAEDAQDFHETCKQDWLELRSELEPRELEDALEQCDAGLKELRSARRDEMVCDDLRALYLVD